MLMLKIIVAKLQVLLIMFLFLFSGRVIGIIGFLLYNTYVSAMYITLHSDPADQFTTISGGGELY